MLSTRPPITTTIHSLPNSLLEELLYELSTLASVYHKPPATFLGHGRFGAEAMQRAAIEEQRQNARENPIAAAAAAAVISGAPASAAAPQNNAENLLDIDFDGAAPASLQKEPGAGLSGLEGLAGTPQRVASPMVSMTPASTGVESNGMGNGMDDLIGVFGNSNGGLGGSMRGGQDGGGAQDDLMNGFAGLDMSGGEGKGEQQQPPKRNNEDILGLF